MRKFVEMVLALELEKRISKSRILSAYLCKVKLNSYLVLHWLSWRIFDNPLQPVVSALWYSHIRVFIKLSLHITNIWTIQIYWGHGIYGVKSASKFYFGKHPSLLTLGECALLVGMIPAPELRSPFRDYGRLVASSFCLSSVLVYLHPIDCRLEVQSTNCLKYLICRGKTFQARVLKRMVDGRFLGVDAALSAIRRSDSLKPAALDAAEHSLLPCTKVIV